MQRSEAVVSPVTATLIAVALSIPLSISAFFWLSLLFV